MMDKSLPFSTNGLLGGAAVYAKVLHKARLGMIEISRVLAEWRQNPLACQPAKEQ